MLAASCPLGGQQTTAASQVSQESKFGCGHAADPRRRQHACNDQDFFIDDTLAGGWNNIGKAAKRIGIIPTASYAGTLQTNVTGGRDQVWSYAGLLSIGLSSDLNELIKAPGLSAYVGISWGMGSNLSDSLASTMLTWAYAPSFYLGEMYLQQKLFKKLPLWPACCAANTFALLPAFSNYVTYAINPNPFSLGANDVTFFGPPTGTQWGAQASYAVKPSVQFSVGAFNTNVNSANGEDHGADFTLQEGNKGVLAMGEIDYLRNQRANSLGKPAQITFGALSSNSSFPSLAPA